MLTRSLPSTKDLIFSVENIFLFNVTVAFFSSIRGFHPSRFAASSIGRNGPLDPRAKLTVSSAGPAREPGTEFSRRRKARKGIFIGDVGAVP